MIDIPLPEEQEFILEIYSNKDNLGRQRFFAYWLDSSVPGGVRGQVSYTKVETFVEQAKQQGFKVRVIVAEEAKVG